MKAKQTKAKINFKKQSLRSEGAAHFEMKTETIVDKNVLVPCEVSV